VKYGDTSEEDARHIPLLSVVNIVLRNVSSQQSLGNAMAPGSIQCVHLTDLNLFYSILLSPSHPLPP